MTLYYLGPGIVLTLTVQPLRGVDVTFRKSNAKGVKYNIILKGVQFFLQRYLPSLFFDYIPRQTIMFWSNNWIFMFLDKVQELTRYSDV